MGFLIPAVMGWFRTNPRNVWLIAGLIGAVAFLAFVYARGRSDQAQREDARQAVAEAAAIASDTKADTKATAAQVEAAQVLAEKEGKLIDAVAEVPDTVPDAAAVRLGCERLRQAGISTADLPACATPRR
jgi:predicted lipid-binding transport protein (Tim44 family)